VQELAQLAQLLQAQPQFYLLAQQLLHLLLDNTKQLLALRLQQMFGM
jgi:hypothetical protein